LVSLARAGIVELIELQRGIITLP
ncbi:MAG: hypothetical protein JWO80_5650, partial [Bryobacterales bacterium]|nr:hypothetical protein [Bryobacterales bacterium]